MSKEQTGIAAVESGIEFNPKALVSFTMVNEGLANDETVIRTIEQRVRQMENHNEVDLVEALSRRETSAQLKKVNAAAIASIFCEMDLKGS